MIRTGEFHQSNDQRLPDAAYLLHGVSCHASIEARDEYDGSPYAETHLISMKISIFEDIPTMALPSEANDVTDTPHSSKEASQSRKWSDAIDLEYSAPIKRGTWH